MMPSVYRITYPNGKIYVGKDETDDVRYFGSPQRHLIAADFPDGARQSFTITRDILWFSPTADRRETNAVEKRFILELRANDPEIGYNRRPKHR
jgi:hypothetical protein